MRAIPLLVLGLAIAAPAAGSSRGAPPARLLVLPLETAPGAAAETDVDLSFPRPGGLAAASVEEYVPEGYSLRLGRPAGTVIGTATVRTPRGPGALAADLLTADPGEWTDDPCAPGLHAAVWQARRGSFSLAVFVDPTAGDERARGAYRLAFCAPPGPLADVDLDLRGGVENPSGGGVLAWRALVTPRAGEPFEVRSLVAVPQRLGLRATVVRATGALLSTGRLLSAGRPRAGVAVHVAIASRADLSDARELGVALTRPDGSYALRAPPRAWRGGRVAVAAYVNFYAGGCSGPAAAPGGCTDETIAPPPAAIVTLAVPGPRGGVSPAS